MTDRELPSKSAYVSNVKILDVQKRYNPGPKHYVFVIQVTWTNPSNIFIIYRRYKQFFDLQCKLLDLFAETPSPSNNGKQSRLIPFLPGKIILGRSQIRQIALERKEALNEYCQTLISLPGQISRSRPVLEFFQPLESDVQKPTESTRNNKKIISTTGLLISAPMKLPTYRCLSDFTASDTLEMSLKRNTLVQVLQKHTNGWWFVQHEDQRGFVPGAYLEPSEQPRGARERKIVETPLNEMHLVTQTYQAKGPDELSLDQGSFVNVIEKSLTGWWRIKFNDTIGQFPSIYLSSCQGRYTPESMDASSNQDSEREFNDSDWDDDDEDVREVSNHHQPEIWYAHSSFVDDRGDCLSFHRGDEIEIHRRYSNGWWSGRAMNDSPVLTWIPSNYLQKERVADNQVEGTNSEESADSDMYSNVIQIYEEIPREKIKVEESIPEIIELPVVVVEPPPPPETVEIPHREIVKPPPIPIAKKPSPVVDTVKTNKPSSFTPTNRVAPIEDSKPKSVKDLVKIFNQ